MEIVQRPVQLRGNTVARAVLRMAGYPMLRDFREPLAETVRDLIAR